MDLKFAASIPARPPSEKAIRDQSLRSFHEEIGLTVREEFIRSAMQGLASNPAYADVGSDMIANQAIVIAEKTLALI